VLPTEKTPVKTSLLELSTLVYGPSKIGKSTFASHFDHAIFLATEAGLNTLQVYQSNIQSWTDLLTACKDLSEGKHAFRTIVLDTVDNAYRMCSEHVCKANNVTHESDLQYGKGYALVNGEFHRVLTKLSQLPYGLVLISHSQEKERETRTGKVVKTVPTLPEGARKIVLGLVDLILYCDVEPVKDAAGNVTTRRVIRTKPHEAYEAGDRTGKLPEVIDLDHAKFIAAFSGDGQTTKTETHKTSSSKGATK
jgi:hypothetical protein